MKKVIKETVVIGNIKYVYPELPTRSCLRVAVGVLSLSNQKSDVDDSCIPVICGWNENPAVGFTDFQWWIGCNIEECSFIVGNKKIPFNKKIFLSPKDIHGEPSVVLEFKDGARLRLVVRDQKKPIEVCVSDGSADFLKKKIAQYGYTDLSGE